ncbi:MAG: mitochondrial fission ELM1 family protein, partial [Porticoccaceae bacterium]|nr:mitochondrial fission ELM1 family protein [Porticoccaceae bacterium]
MNNTATNRPALTVWCLSDSRPGHFNQSKGLLQALEQGYAVNLHWIDCTLQAKPLRPLLRGLLNAGLGQSLLPSLHRFDNPAANDPTQTPDLIISTGGNTAYLNIALAQRYGCRNLFIGSLRGLKPSLFSAVLTIEPIGTDNNLLMPLAPVPSDRDAQAEAAQALRTELAFDDNQR